MKRKEQKERAARDAEILNAIVGAYALTIGILGLLLALEVTGLALVLGAILGGLPGWLYFVVVVCRRRWGL